MKKYILIISLIIFTSSIASSQILISLIFGDKLNSDKLEFGIDGGINWANISNLDNSKAQGYFNLGFYFDIKMTEKLLLHTGVMVKSTMGTTNLSPYSLGNVNLDSVLMDGTVTKRLSYFNVPILLKLKLYDHFFVEFGPQLGLLYKAYDNFSVDVFEDEDLEFNNKIRDQYNRIDAGITAGLGYRLLKGSGMQFGARYYYGLVDILKDNTGSKQLNSSLYIFASIPIGKDKPESKK